VPSVGCSFNPRLNEAGEDETLTFEPHWHDVFDPFVVGSMCTCPDAYTCDRVAYSHSRCACIRHTHSHSHGDADQYPCTDSVGHTYAGPNHHPNTDTIANHYPHTDAVADCHPNAEAHSNLDTNGATYAYPNANRYAHAEPHTGRRARHRLLPCQRGRG
jgi:hypothetical protein